MTNWYREWNQRNVEASNHHPIPFIIFIINSILMHKIISSNCEFIKFNLFRTLTKQNNS